MTWLKQLCAALAVLLLGACGQLPASDSDLHWHPLVQRGELANGLRYNLVPIATQKGRLDIRLTVHAGSVDEADDQVGVAHLLEHLSFYSHAGQPLDVRQRLQQAGWQQGRNFNALTSYERTQYLLSPPDGTASAELALQALATLVFAGDYSAADLQRERPIVVEEWRGGLGVAQRMNALRTAAQRSGSRYPAHRSIGNRQAIEQAPLAALQAFQRRWYLPNNMQLNIVGDFDPAVMARQIDTFFAQPARGATPAREHLELPLDDRLKVFRVQDSQSGSNQVVLLLRFQQQDIRTQTLAAGRERLLDRLALDVLSRQLRRQAKSAAVAQLSTQKTQIGRRSGVLAVAAKVTAEEHAQALQGLLRELARVRQHPLYEADVQAAKAEIRQIAERMLSNPAPRDFDTWVRQLNDATLGERVLQDPTHIARNSLTNLSSISTRELQQRIAYWLDSPDRVLQLSAPGTHHVSLPAADTVEQQARDWAARRLEPPQAPVAVAPVTIPSLTSNTPSGQINSRQDFTAERVEHWQLSNGDRLVWLRAPGAEGQAQLRVDSSAGFMYQGTAAWRAQIASQLALQTPPQGWSEAQFKAWKQREGVQLNFTQGAQRLEAQGQAAPAQLASLLALYQAQQTRSQLDDDAYRESLAALRQQLQRQPSQVRSEQDSTWRRLKQGQDDWQTPNAAQIDALSRAQLQDEWRRQAAAPVTYYLMADLPSAELQALVSRYLAGIPRGAALLSQPSPRQPGQRQASLASAREPRASLYASSFQAHPWSPADAARVAALGQIASSLLKQRLRGEAGGIYSLTFDSQLSPEHQRIDSELRFSSAPQRAEELWQLARQTLADLPNEIDPKRLASMRRELARQEDRHRQDPATQLQRLILSERAWHDPRYLSQQQQLPAALQLAAMQGLARQLFPRANQVYLQVLPAADVEQ